MHVPWTAGSSWGTTMNDHWMSVWIRLPADRSPELIKALEALGFVENDICALNREQDGANVSYGPMDPPGQRPYGWELA